MALAKRGLGLVLTISSFSLVLVTAAEQQGERVKQVDSKYVCMITKKHFATEQMQVSIEGRSYYTCCEMCKTQLLEDPSTRVDIDPVSGNQVDKAIAIVGVDKAGNVYFFENTPNLLRFRVPPKTQAKNQK
jgi:YHS domain-containing protein